VRLIDWPPPPLSARHGFPARKPSRKVARQSPSIRLISAGIVQYLDEGDKEIVDSITQYALHVGVLVGEEPLVALHRARPWCTSLASTIEGRCAQ